jgi:hypothetical protein
VGTPDGEPVPQLTWSSIAIARVKNAKNLFIYKTNQILAGQGIL